MTTLIVPTTGVLAALAIALQDNVGSAGTIVNSVVGAAVIVVVGLFLRFLATERKEAREERNLRSKEFKDAIDLLVAREREFTGQVSARLDALAQHQDRTNTALERIVDRLRKTA
jgi:hypothetical protein